MRDGGETDGGTAARPAARRCGETSGEAVAR